MRLPYQHIRAGVYLLSWIWAARSAWIGIAKWKSDKNLFWKLVLSMYEKWQQHQSMRLKQNPEKSFNIFQVVEWKMKRKFFVILMCSSHFNDGKIHVVRLCQNVAFKSETFAFIEVLNSSISSHKHTWK